MEWININDDLPDADVDVLFVTEDDTMYVGSLCDCKSCNSFHYNSTSHEPNDIENVTHWKPLTEESDDLKLNKFINWGNRVTEEVNK